MSTTWLHFFLVVTLLLVVQGSAELSLGGVERGLMAIASRSVARLFPLLPIACAISLMGDSHSWTTLRVLVVTYAIMVSSDLLAGPGLGDVSIAATTTGIQQMSTGISPEDVSMLRTFGAYFTGGLEGVDEIVVPFPPGHPRVLFTTAAVKVAFLLAPLIVTGIVVGVGAWIDDRVQFRTRRDQAVARFATAWVLAPLVTVAAFSWPSGSATTALFGGQSFWTTLVPQIPLTVLGIVGWRIALRGRR